MRRGLPRQSCTGTKRCSPSNLICRPTQTPLRDAGELHVSHHMHRAFIAAVTSIIALFIAHAAFAPVYETGFARISSPVLYIAFAAPFFGVLLRRSWAWRTAMMITWMYPVIHIIFFPVPEFYGTYTLHARVLVALEIGTCVLMIILMRQPVIRARFVLGGNYEHDD